MAKYTSQEVISDSEFLRLIVGLINLGFTPNESAMHVSILETDFACGETHCVMICKRDRTFHILENAEKTPIGTHVYRT